MFKILDLGTSLFSGKEASHKRDAQMLFKLSFELQPSIRELAFYNNNSISVLPSPLLNRAFRAVINLSMPKSDGNIILKKDISPDDFSPPTCMKYHCAIWFPW